MLLLWAAFGEEWALGHKVTFDGPNKRIIVAPGIADLDVKEDVYSAWKEWSRLRDNTKYLPAIRSIGGDPIGGGKFAGDLYFLQNDWRMVVSEEVNVLGALYSDDGGSPFIINAGGGVISTVSNLATAVSAEAAPIDNEQVAKAVWDFLMTAANQPGSFGEHIRKNVFTKIDKFALD